MKSASVTCADIKTDSASYLNKLKEEIERVKTCTHQFIDGDFLQGTVQREEKHDYLHRLVKELESIESVTSETRRHASKSMNAVTSGVSYQSAEDTVHDEYNQDLASQHISDFERRRNQFQFRIAAIEKELSEIRDSINDIDKNRAFTIKQISSAQERILLISGEFDRVSLSSGKETPSDIIHGFIRTEDFLFCVGFCTVETGC